MVFSSSRVGNWLRRADQDEAELPRVIEKLGVKCRFAARHPGQDPWLFLDLRAGRRRVMQLASGRSVLNLFAYTCGVGMAAAFAGAREVVNVDFAQSGLAVGQQSAALNSVGVEQVYLKTDVFSALRQWSGLDQLERSAKKCGRPLQNSAWIEPEGDFPRLDGQPPLKMVELRV